jgi:hypothetical protein
MKTIIEFQKKEKIISFFPRECQFHWDGKGKLPQISLLIYNLHKKQLSFCEECGEAVSCLCRLKISQN